MYQRKTVFVIGAGCSAEFGLPVGSGLVEVISQGLMGQRRQIIAALANWGLKISTEEMDDLFCRFLGGLHAKGSIDQYLDFHRSDEAFVMIGKLAIAWAILERERTSLLRRVNVEGGISCIKDTWLMKLFHGMNNDTQIDAVERLFDNVSFICFNYDRCIEVAFFNAIRVLTGASTGAKLERVAEAMKSLRIWHPYGTVGPIDYRDGAASKPLFGFPEHDPDWTELLAAAKDLRTFTEGMNDELKRSEMHAAMGEAQQIVYLGFGFLDQNMELLTAGNTNSRPQIYATCHELSVANKKLALHAMARASPVAGTTVAERAGWIEVGTDKETQAAAFIDAWGKTLRS